MNLTPFPLHFNSHGEVIHECPKCKKPNAINEPGTKNLIELPILCYSCGATIVGIWERISDFPGELESKKEIRAEKKAEAEKKPLMKCRFCDFHTRIKATMEDHLEIKHEAKAKIFIENSKVDKKNWIFLLESLGSIGYDRDSFHRIGSDGIEYWSIR